ESSTATSVQRKLGDFEGRKEQGDIRRFRAICTISMKVYPLRPLSEYSWLVWPKLQCCSLSYFVRWERMHLLNLLQFTRKTDCGTS
uniref:Uncharacterized protein n=1 Tax=Triticum urartu TaxID=4572 RepID=A0A8R7V325_TRIUA